MIVQLFIHFIVVTNKNCDMYNIAYRLSFIRPWSGLKLQGCIPASPMSQEPATVSEPSLFVEKHHFVMMKSSAMHMHKETSVTNNGKSCNKPLYTIEY